jgi:uncharacterized membrane protein (TIGR02234 family)
VIRDVAVRAAELAQVPVAALVGMQRQHWGAVFTLAAAAFTLAGSVMLLRAAATPKPDAGKYVAPAARRAAEHRDEKGDGMSERMIWDALDEGRDPTSSDNEGR